MQTGAATAEACVQTVSWDLKSGTTQITAGPPTHLGLGDYLALLGNNRQRNFQESGGNGKTGREDAHDPFTFEEPESSDGAAWELVLCDSSGSRATESDATHFRVNAGGVGSKASTELDENPFQEGDEPPKIFPLTDSGVVYVWAERDGLEQTGAGWDKGADLPGSTDTKQYRQVGSWNSTGGGGSVQNDMTGHIPVVICRDWFSSPATYSFTVG